MMARAIIFFTFIVVVSGGLRADTSLFDTFGDGDLLDKDFKETKKVEGDVIIPIFPKSKNLLPVQVEHEKRKFYIDTKSLSVGKDRIPRYTVVIESPSGVRSVAFEAIRCHDKFYKTYAYGDVKTKKFNVLSNPKWRPISATIGPYRYRVDLVEVFVCNGTVTRRKVRDIVQALKYPPQPDAYK